VELKRRHGDRIRDGETNEVLAHLAVARGVNVGHDARMPKPQPTKEPRGMSPTAKIALIALTILLFIWVFAELSSFA
jgi:hypothetical protein